MKRTFVVFALCAAVLALVFGITQEALAAQIGLFEKHKNIGTTPKKGSAMYDASTGEYSVTGGGANIWGQTDDFEFVYRRLSGDLSFAADVDFVGKGMEQHRKAALMIRQSLAANSAYADVALHGSGLTSLQYRETTGATTLETRSDVKAPTRIHIERHGNQFTISAGGNGQDMKTTGPIMVTMHDPVYIGLAVCSHNAKVLETAVFSNVRLAAAATQGNSRKEEK